MLVCEKNISTSHIANGAKRKAARGNEYRSRERQCASFLSCQPRNLPLRALQQAHVK
ncbi:MAG: hypothetical protein WBA39_25255 [Rivularia sp. (in: cyanobacteria)]